MVSCWEWPAEVELRPVPEGLINQTFWVLVEGRTEAVLQRLNTEIFIPEVSEDVEAVTAHLERRGVTTPRLLRTREDGLWATAVDDSVWRCLTAVGESTIHRLTNPSQARSAATLVGRFHAAVEDLEWQFRCRRPGFQDSERHLANLDQALDEHRDHRLYDGVAELAEEVRATWQAWSGPRDLPQRIVHGDLKISNVRFVADEAHALIDLDTLAHGTIDAELGDAMRSWCNPAGEDTLDAVFDLDLFAAAMEGYVAGLGSHGLSELEWAAIVPGVERITLNLTARFAADALQERYFGWDPRHGGRGEHNLLRARGQAALLRQVTRHRSAAAQALHHARQLAR
jgi:Ser/Thr protein kinase RdoA (MazF antagonist)